jgi:hypothetical protein
MLKYKNRRLTLLINILTHSVCPSKIAERRGVMPNLSSAWEKKIKFTKHLNKGCDQNVYKVSILVMNSFPIDLSINQKTLNTFIAQKIKIKLKAILIHHDNPLKSVVPLKPVLYPTFNLAW